jgi:hypothetical protein
MTCSADAKLCVTEAVGECCTELVGDVTNGVNDCAAAGRSLLEEDLPVVSSECDGL